LKVLNFLYLLSGVGNGMTIEAKVLAGKAVLAQQLGPAVSIERY
jgi:hypothetical protein